MKPAIDQRRVWLRSRTSLSMALTAVLAGATAAIAGPQPTGAASRDDPTLLVRVATDLGLSQEQASDWLREQPRLRKITDFYRALLDEDFAGAWLVADEHGKARLVVASTVVGRPASHDNVELVQVDLSLEQLQDMTAALDTVHRGSLLRRPAEAVIGGWYVDVERNQVVVEYLKGNVEAAIELVAATGIPTEKVAFAEIEAMPELASTIIGGDRYNMSTGGWCSIGFSARRAGQDGFVTAGHCGQVGTGTTGSNWVSQGIFDYSVFPGEDSAWVRITNAAWTLTSQVLTSGGPLAVSGQASAPINAPICRSGARTGWRCGAVTGLSQTVNYPQGTVYGLTRASACAGQGDSGGSFITPDGQAQGVTSGGQLGADGTNCGFANPVTYFQPLGPLLSASGATLFTGGGNGSPPMITGFACPDPANSGSLMFMCYVEYSSGSPAQAQWQSSHQQPMQGDWYFGRCSRFASVWVSVTVSNAFGQTTRSANFACPTGPIP